MQKSTMKFGCKANCSSDQPIFFFFFFGGGGGGGGERNRGHWEIDRERSTEDIPYV